MRTKKKLFNETKKTNNVSSNKSTYRNLTNIYLTYSPMSVVASSFLVLS